MLLWFWDIFLYSLVSLFTVILSSVSLIVFPVISIYAVGPIQ